MAALPNLKRGIGNRVTTSLSASVTDVALTMTVSDATGMNADGGYIMIDEEYSNKREIVYVESITSNTLTISTSGRGLAGTTAVSHDSGATVTDIVVDENVNGIIDTFSVGHSDAGAHVLPNNTALSIKESGGTVRDVVKVTSGNILEIGTNNSLDHTVINAGTDKLVKIKVLRQDDTTNAYNANSVILTGWGFVTGDGANRYIIDVVSFGITYSERPVVVVSAGGTKINSDPTHVGDGANLAVTYKANGYSMATTGFTAIVSTASYDGADPGVFGATARYLYDWIAVGQLN